MWDGWWERLNDAIILYSLGRKTEALDILGMIFYRTDSSLRGSSVLL